MIILDATTDSLQAVLAGAVVTTEPSFYASYIDVTTSTYTPGENHGATTGATDVTLVAAPGASTQRQVKYVSIYNRDTASVTVTIELDVSATDTILTRAILQPNETLEYTDGQGWKTRDSNGNVKSQASLGVSAISAGTTQATSGQVVFSNSNNVTFGMNNGTVTANVGQVFSTSLFAYGPPSAQTSSSLGQNSVHFWPQVMNHNLSANCVFFPILITNSSSATASCQKGQTIKFGIYTRINTNSTCISRIYSTSYTIAASHNSNASWMLSMITGVGNSTSYNTLSASSAGLNLSSSLHGARNIIMPVSSQFTAGEYWFALHNSTSSAGVAGAVLGLSNICGTFLTHNRLGVAIAAGAEGVNRYAGWGIYSVTSAALPSTLSLNQIQASGVNPVMYMMPDNQ